MTPSPRSPTIELLLEHSTWARRLARRLVADDGTADDVMQDVLARALERPPATLGSVAAARGWLAVAVRGVVANLRRADANRRARESAVARVEALPASDRFLERESARRALVEAVLSLQEPYREAVLLHHFDELSPRAIAARLGVPLPTVRSRLSRAHAMLRERLERRGLDRATLASLLVLPRFPLLVVPLVKLKLASIVALGAVLLLLLWKAAAPERGAAQPEPALAAALGSQAESPEAAAGAGAPDREVVPGATRAREPRASIEGVLVRVVDCERFEPVAGAEVRWASWEWISATSSRQSVDSDTQDARVRESGRVGTTGDDGTLRIAAGPGNVLVQARFGGLWGQRFTSSGSGETCELVLAPDGDLLVEVLDRDGLPLAGVRVGACRATDTQWIESVNADTGSDGLARLPHARARLIAGAAKGTLLVSALTADPDAPRAFVEVPPWPAAPVSLRLGPSGTVVIDVVDASGESVQAPTEVQLTVRMPDRPHATLHGLALGGSVTFEHVPIGAQLSLFCFPRSEGHFSGPGTHAAGPRVAGERVLVSAPVCTPPATLTGRALDADGDPLARTELSLSVREAAHLPPLESATRVETDDEGRFRTALPDSLAAQERELVLVARGSERGLEGLAPFRASAAKSDGNLGDIRLSPAPRLVSGRVLDEHGAAVADARLQLLHFTPATQAGEFEVEIAGAVAVEWEVDTLREARSDERGRFELLALDTRGRYALQAFARGFPPGPQLPFDAGASEVELVLKRGLPPLRGRVLVPSAETLPRLSISAGLRGGTIDAFGRFTIPRPSEDPVDFELRADGLGPEPLVTVAGVSDPDDPRLAALDLRALVREFRFRVVGPDGVPVRSVKVNGRTRSGTGWQIEAPGEVCLLARESVLDLALHSDGHLPASFEGVRAGDVLTLERLPVLLLRVPESLPEAGEGLVYSVQATREGAKSVRVSIDSGRDGRLRLGGPGTWKVLWTVRGTGIWLQETQVVVGKGDVTCELDATREAVEAARAEAQARARKSVK